MEAVTSVFLPPSLKALCQNQPVSMCTVRSCQHHSLKLFVILSLMALVVCAELHEPVLHVRESSSPEESLVWCSATGGPAPTVTLTVPQQHLHFSQYNTSRVTNSNNTVTVTTTAVLSGLHDDSTQVGCAARVDSGPQMEVLKRISELKHTSDDGEKLIKDPDL